MRHGSFYGVLFGLTLLSFLPVRAEYKMDRISLKMGSIRGEAVEQDLYYYSGWNSKYFTLDFTNKFSWPENNQNYSKFGVKAGFGELNPLKLNIDYQWNERYRILSPEIKYNFKFRRDLTIGVEFETVDRDPVKDKDREFRYRQEKGTIKTELDRDSWSYELKLAQTQKEYQEDEGENYTTYQLNQDFAWWIPNFKLNLSYHESTNYYPYNINQDGWSSEAGIGGEYRFSEHWQLTATLRDKEEEKGLVPYLNQRNLDFKLKNRLTNNLTFSLRADSTRFNYYSETGYTDPDKTASEDEDRKSRDDSKAALECEAKLKKTKLTVGAGLFQLNRDYDSTLVEDIDRKGLYASIRWNPGKIGFELELAPNGNLSRVNGFYQLKLNYDF